METLIVVPTYNEAGNLQPLVEGLLSVAPVHVLIIDDSSPDGTGEIAHELSVAYPGRVFSLRRPGKLGLGSAYISGFKWALGHDRRFDRVVQMDADFSHDPADVPALLAHSEQAGLVIGSRYVKGGATPGWPWWRRLISKTGSRYAGMMLHLPVHDLTGGFKCFRRETLVGLDLDGIQSSGYSFQIEMTFRSSQNGVHIAEVPIVFRDRRWGRSKMSLGIMLEALAIVWRLRLEPLRRPWSKRPSSSSTGARR